MPALCGATAGAVGLIRDTESALEALNRFALTFAFPALVLVAMLKAPPDMTLTASFFVANLLVIGGGTLALGLVARRLRPDDPTGAHQLTVVFGNTAYLGLPFAERVLAPEVFPIAVAGVVVHVTCAITAGPTLLLRHTEAPRAGAWRTIAGRVARQPLVWAPFAGLAGRWLPAEVQAFLIDLLGPLGSAAAPVALFVLGLYVYSNRAALTLRTGLDPLAWLPKLVLLPLLAWGLATALGLPSGEVQVTVLLAAMPTAITTFAFAQEYGVGRSIVAPAIVWSSTLCLVSLTLLATWLASAG